MYTYQNKNCFIFLLFHLLIYIHSYTLLILLSSSYLLLILQSNIQQHCPLNTCILKNRPLLGLLKLYGLNRLAIFRYNLLNRIIQTFYLFTSILILHLAVMMFTKWFLIHFICQSNNLL